MSRSVLLNEAEDDGQQRRLVESGGVRQQDNLGPGEALGIAFEQFNVFGSAISSIRDRVEMPEGVENFDPTSTDIFQNNPEAAAELISADSRAQQEFILERRREEQRDLAQLRREDGGDIARLAAEIAQPSSVLPFGAFKVGTKAATAMTFGATAAEQATLATTSRAVDYQDALKNTAFTTGAAALFGRLPKGAEERQVFNITTGQRDRVVADAASARRTGGDQPTGQAQPTGPRREAATSDTVGERDTQAPREAGARPVRPSPDDERAAFDAVQEELRRRQGRGDATTSPDFSEAAPRDPEQTVEPASPPDDLRDTIIANRLSASELVPAGGVEKVGTNPRFRLLGSINPESRDVAPRLAPMSGLLQNQNLRNVVTPTSVSTLRKQRYLSRQQDVENKIRENFLRHRGVEPSDTEAGRTFQITRENVRNFAARGQDELLNERQFNEAVGRAVRNDGDPLGRPEVDAAAGEVRKLLDDLGNDATRVGLVDEVIGKGIAQRQRQIEELRQQQAELADDAERARISDRINKIEEDIEAQQRRLDDIKRNGLTQNTAPAFFPRIVRRDLIDAEPERFKEILRQNLSQENLRSGQSFEEKVNEVFENFRGVQNSFDLTDDGVGTVRSLEERAEIPDREIEDFLENDAVAVLRNHANSFGGDILLKEQLGSVDLAPQIDRVREQGGALASRAETAQEAERIRRLTERDVRDIRELRDRIRGTAGQTRDPLDPVARGARFARIANTLSMAGAFGTSQLAEAGNVVLVNGLSDALGSAYASTFSEFADEVRGMTKATRDEIGASAQITTGLTSAQFAEGDVFGRALRSERFAGNLAQNIFQLSGASMVTSMTQQLATTARMFNMNKAIRRVARDQPEGDDVERLANVGIDRDMAQRINEQLNKHATSFDGVNELANTASFDDLTAKQAYETALLDDVNRTAIMPDEGDRANFTVTPLGRVVAQFQSFTQAAQSKILASGLQRKDAQMLQGIAALTAMGGLVHEIKRFQFGENDDESVTEKLMASIEQSGMGALFLEGANQLDTLSGDRLSSLISGSKPEALTARNAVENVVSVGGGPTGQQAVALTDLAEQLASEGPSQDALSTARRFIPGQNLPFVDPFADATFGE